MKFIAPPITQNELNLLSAAREGNMPLLGVVLWRTENYDARDKLGNAVLHLACENATNKDEIVKFLLDKPTVDVNAKNMAGQTALHKLAVNGDSRAVGYLVDASANPLAVDHSGSSAAHLYITNAFMQGLEVLLEKFYQPRLIINQPDGQGNTLLHLAAIHRPLFALDLLAKGANPCLANKNAQYPEDLCGDAVVKKMMAAQRKNILKSLEKMEAERQANAVENNSDDVRLLEFANKALDFLAHEKPKKIPKI